MKLLEVDNLHTYFNTTKGQLRAVNGVSFCLEYGEVLGLVGESGCGKTTCALSIAKLLPKEGEIAGGRILLEGKDLAPMPEEEIRKRRWKDVSVIFQGAMNALNPVMKVGDQIGEAILLHEKTSREDARRRTAKILEQVEIPAARAGNYPHEFSGGMKQRVMIAMALACNPKIVIGDEPTTALDVMVQAQILNLLEKIRKEYNMGFILITHDLSVLGETCDKIAVMYAGKIVEMGTVADIFKRTAHPYTQKLISCFPDIQGEKSIPEGIPGTPPNMLALGQGCSFAPRCGRKQPVCETLMPESRQIGAGHFAACHFAEGGEAVE